MREDRCDFREGQRPSCSFALASQALLLGDVAHDPDGFASVVGLLAKVNPEARRLLQVPADWKPGCGGGLPPGVKNLIAEIPEKGFFSEQEGSITAVSGNRSIGILRAK
jgi:hypothetical protein